MATLEVDPRARRARVVQLAEELVAHATVEQLLFYPYSEDLLGVEGLAAGIETAVEALLDVLMDVDDDVAFARSLGRLLAQFERHVEEDEADVLPLVQAVGSPTYLARMGRTIEDFEHALASSRPPGEPGFWVGPEQPAAKN